MKLDVYVNYAGTCEAAFRFYEEHLGGTITPLMRHGDQPNSGVPDSRNDAVLHARMEIGSAVLMGADIPAAEPMRSAYLTLTLESAEAAERIYELLSEGGQIFMKMEETFFATRFAELRDRFGTSWMLLCERATPDAARRRDQGRRRRGPCRVPTFDPPATATESRRSCGAGGGCRTGRNGAARRSAAPR